MGDCEEFYHLRDRASVKYVGHALRHDVAVHIAIDAPSAAAASGQLALLTLANQLARTTRRISFEVPDPGVDTVVPTPFNQTDLGSTLLSTVTAIDPCGQFALGGRCEGSSVSIGLGSEVGRGFDWYIGADRSIAFLSRSPIGFVGGTGTLRGAGLASCLGSGAAFRSQLRLPTEQRVLSVWNYAEGDAAEPGPDSLGTIDIGRVLVVGAGAVGAGLAYWLHAFGTTAGSWAIVDGDSVELDNTNRSLVFTPRHAGWPTGEAVPKASLIAPLISGAVPYPCWYDECSAVHRERFDVVVALANERHVKEQLSHLNVSVAFQATTGENWLSQLHRHIVGQDGCIWCRTGEVATPAFGCSTGVVEDAEGRRSDAALPFLSASSGLMLAVALERLAHGGLGQEPHNCWSWDFESQHRMTARPSVRSCREGCAFVLPAHVRKTLNAGRKWESLDLV